MQSLAPRTAGFLPGIGARHYTCFPETGEPKELNSVAQYEALPRRIIPTHRPVKLTLHLTGLRIPVDTLWKPSSFIDKFPERGKVGKGE
eukprot:11036792-Heterocapsa_arctica.AAC.1